MATDLRQLLGLRDLGHIALSIMCRYRKVSESSVSSACGHTFGVLTLTQI